MRCASCGSELRPRDRYCDSCGEPARDDARSLAADGWSVSEAQFLDAGAYSGWEPVTDTYPLRSAEPRQARAGASTGGGVGSRLAPERVSDEADRGWTPEPLDVVGQVSGFNESTRTRRLSNLDREPSTEIVWTFYIERFDRSGNRLDPVPVNMSGTVSSGRLRDGDVVGVPRREMRGRGGLLRPRRIYNLRTRTVLELYKRRKGPGVIVAVAVFMVFWVGVATTVIYAMLAGPPPWLYNGP